MRPIKRLVLAWLVASALAALAAAPAAAYGNAGGAQQLYQVTESTSCNNVSVCGSLNLGGFWAWGVFYADGTFDAEVTFCAHVSSPSGPGMAGAGHEHVSGTYALVDLGQGPWIVLTSEVDTLTGQGHGTVIVVPSEFMPLAPAAKVHVSTASVFGFTAPGVTYQATVTPMHT